MAEPKVGADVFGALGIVALLMIIGSVIGDSMVGALLAPIGFACIVYCMTRVPLRYSMMGLMFVVFSFENPGDAESQWSLPVHTAMSLMNSHLNTIDRSLGFTSFMSFSGMDLCLVTLFGIAYMRKQSGFKLDGVGHVKTPKPLLKLGYLALGGIAFTWVTGMLRGGLFNMSLWQLDRVMYMPAVFFLSHLSFRGSKDSPAIAKVILFSATYKAIIALIVLNVVDMPPDPETGSTRITCATNHADSILFAVAFVLVLAMLIERVKSKAKWVGLACLPIISGGMIANNRRMVWVEVAAVFLIVYMVARDGPVKKKIRRTLTVLSPAIIGYLVAGWDSKSPVFKPAQMVRSIIDPQSDGSTLWRELENYDIITTFKMHPLIGTGYGNGYLEFMPLPAIPYELEHYAPHNSVLGLWCYAGYVGALAITLLWVGGIYFGMRAYHATKDHDMRATALVSFGSVVIYLCQCWGDMGLGTWNGIWTVAPSIAMAGKLLVQTGEWSNKKPAKKDRKEAPRPPPPGQVDPRAA